MTSKVCKNGHFPILQLVEERKSNYTEIMIEKLYLNTLAPSTLVDFHVEEKINYIFTEQPVTN